MPTSEYDTTTLSTPLPDQIISVYPMPRYGAVRGRTGQLGSGKRGAGLVVAASHLPSLIKFALCRLRRRRSSELSDLTGRSAV